MGQLKVSLHAVLKLALCICLLALQSLAFSADDLVTSQMVDEARMWQSKGRTDLASNIWRRILVTNPQHVEALASLGVTEALAGNWEEAQSLYQRAKRQGKATSAAMIRLNELMQQQERRSEAQILPSRSTASVASETPQKRTRVKAESESGRSSIRDKPKSNATATPIKETALATASAQIPAGIVLPPPAEVQVTPITQPRVTSTKLTDGQSTSGFDSEVRLKTSEAINGTNVMAVSKPSFDKESIDRMHRIKPCKVSFIANTPTTN